MGSSTGAVRGVPPALRTPPALTRIAGARRFCPPLCVDDESLRCFFLKLSEFLVFVLVCSRVFDTLLSSRQESPSHTSYPL